MVNFTQFPYFTLSAYFDTGRLKYLYFLVILSLYVLIVCINILLIVLILMNRSLHEPMYLFLCSLFVNELYGSAAFFPFMMIQILSDIHTVPTSFCFLQIFCVYTYAAIEFAILSVMSYDRYLAICHPLQYNSHMTSNKVAKLIALTWFYPLLACSVTISLSAPLQLCGNVINKVFCDNYLIVKLACSDTTVNNIYGLMFTIIEICGPLLVIFYTYIKILKVCFSGSKQTRQKAISTCSPHLASLLNLSFGCFFEIVQSRFNMDSAFNTLRIVLSFYTLTWQPLFNPLVYGLNLSKIRILCKNLFSNEV
ncbi:olfactory receptor 5F1-like [Genypterus blacodes]|uniref:olfactory receptor 5F1-like n=1 Tax=Genypterus blacodes TaxID=154954 RepID=UPI003F771DC6